MKKVKVIFPDGSTADLEESQVDGAIKAGAKRFTDTSVESKQKSSSMVFPDGSIADIPDSDVEGAIKAGAIKKKDGLNGTPAESNTTSPKSAPTTSQSFVSTPEQVFSVAPKSTVVTTNDGVTFPVNDVVTQDLVSTKNTPEAVQALQNRITSKTVTDNDIAALAQSSGKTTDAVKAYIHDGQLKGGSVENIEKVNQAESQLTNYINQFNTIYGTKYDPTDVLSSSEKANDFLAVARKKKAVVPEPANINTDLASSTGTAHNVPVPALLPTNISNEMIRQIVSKTIDEDATNGVPKDATVVKIAKTLNPVEFARVQKAQTPTPETGNYSTLTAFTNLFKNDKQQDEELLNYQKGNAELFYNQTLKQNAVNKISKGVVDGDANMVTQGQHELSTVDDNVVYKYPSLLKQEIAKRVNDEIAKQSGVVEGTETTEGNRLQRVFGSSTNDRLEVMRQQGILDDPRTKDIALEMAGNSSYFANNSIVGGVVGSFLQPFYELGMSGADIVGVRGAKDIFADKIKDELFQKDFSQNTWDELKLKTDVKVSRNVLNTTANLAGMLAISTATEGLAGTMGASASLSQKLGAYTSFGLPSFDASLKDSKNFIDSEPAQYIYAGINAIANAEGGRLLDLGKITRIPGVSEDFAKVAQGLSDNSITESAARELLGKAESKYVDFAVKYGKNVTKGAATMAYFSTVNNVIKYGFGDPNTKGEDILPQAGHAFLDGVLGMSILGGFGAAADMRNEKNTTFKGTIYNMALNHDAAKDVLDIGLKNGNYDKEAYDNKVAILNTAVAAKTFLDVQESQAGVNLNQEQKAVYVANKTAENVLRSKANDATLPETKSKYEEQANRLKDQSNQILEGLKFTPTLEPLQQQFEAEKEYNTALENFNPDVPGTVTALETAKAKVDNASNTDNITNDFNKAEPFIISPQAKEEVGNVITKINNAEYINEKELDQATNHLYDLLDKHGDNQSFSNLIEPLINKIEGYDFRTKTETSTITETVPTEVARPVVERKAVNKSISQWEGNRATITDSNGKSVEGVINLQDGKYYLHNENGDKVAAIGDTAITDRDITLPSTESVPNPIQFDENGHVKSMTLQLNKLDKENGGTVPDKLITINFRDKEKALDYAIQLRAEQVGEYPQPKFDLAYEEIQREIQQEVPVKDLSTPKNTSSPTDNSTVKNEGTTGKTDKPIPANDGQPKEQGVEEVVQPDANKVEPLATEGTSTVLNEPNEKAAEIPVTETKAGATDQSVNPAVELTGDGGKETGIAHAETERLRKEFGLNDYERNNATDAELRAAADEAISKGYNPENLIAQMEKGIPPTGVENFILKRYLATLEAKFDKDQTDENLAQIERLVKATDKVGSITSESLRTRKGTVPVDDSLSGFFITEKEANLDAPLTEAQKENVKKEYADISGKEKNYQETISKLEAENSRLKAEQKLGKDKKQSKPSQTKKTHEDFVKDRQSIIEAAKEKIKAAREKANAPDAPKLKGVGGRTYADDLLTIAPEVLKLVKSYVEEGVTNLGEIIRNVHPVLKEDIPEITEKDVHDIIAGEYNKKQPTKTEAAKNLYEVKMQAQLINKLQKLLDGTEPKNEKAKIKRNQEIESLQKQIKDFKKENPDRQGQLKTLKAKAERDLKSVQEEIATGNFSEPTKKTPFFYDTQLKKDFPELYKQAVKAQNELIKAKQDRQIRLAVLQYENRSKLEKFQDEAIRYLNVPRTLMASMDYSAPLRQAVVVSVAHPGMALKAAAEMFKASFSQDRFDRWSYDLKETPEYKLMQDSGLSLTDPHSLHLQAQEEAFMGNIAEKIPYVGAMIKGSERAYVSYLNKMRVDLFNRYANLAEESGRTFENSPELYKGLASYINNATGRGGLGFIETAAPVLNSFLFSPRLIASRFNMLGLGDIATLGNGFYGKLPKEVRVMAMKDMAKFIAAGIGVLALASLNKNVQVETDPRSSDFGKIREGDTRWDIWGGFQPYIRVLAQVIAGERKSTGSGKIISIGESNSKFGTSRADPLIGFSRGKLAPVPSIAWDLLSGRTVQGNKVLYHWNAKHKDNEITLKDEAVQHFFPLIISDVGQALKNNGVKSLFEVGIPSTFGVGVQTFSNKKK